MPVELAPGVPIQPLTVEQYDGMVDAGILTEDDRVELLEGVLVAVTPQGEKHTDPLERLTAWAFAHFSDRYRIRVQMPLRCGALSEPEPDLALVARDAAWGRHPDAAELVVEVSFTSLRKDTSVKARVYASAGIPEYWIVDVAAGRLRVHRGPAATGFDEVTQARTATFAGAELDVETLLGP